MKEAKSKKIDPTTEEKIKSAAREVFHRKGFAAARTRDIAEEAGLNLALLNYYFRSKKKLFDIIMLESLEGFLKSMTGVFNGADTTLEQKIETIISNYIDLLSDQPNLPLFILSELKSSPEALVSKIHPKEIIGNSIFMKQLTQRLKEREINDVNPAHYVMNIMSLAVFPFVAGPLFRSMGDISEEGYLQLMQQRKALIPMWVKSIL